MNTIKQFILNDFIAPPVKLYKKFFANIKDDIRYSKRARQVNKAVKQAVKLSKADRNCRYYVMQNGSDGQIFVGKKKELNKMVDMGLFPRQHKHFEYYDLENMCLFHTDQKPVDKVEMKKRLYLVNIG